MCMQPVCSWPGRDPRHLSRCPQVRVRKAFASLLSVMSLDPQVARRVQAILACDDAAGELSQPAGGRASSLPTSKADVEGDAADGAGSSTKGLDPAKGGVAIFTCELGSLSVACSEWDKDVRLTDAQGPPWHLLCSQALHPTAKTPAVLSLRPARCPCPHCRRQFMRQRAPGNRGHPCQPGECCTHPRFPSSSKRQHPRPRPRLHRNLMGAHGAGLWTPRCRSQPGKRGCRTPRTANCKN